MAEPATNPRRCRHLLPLLALALFGPPPAAQEKKPDLWKVGEGIRTVEKLGAEIPGDLEFYTVDRKKVDFRELIDKPTILNLVYISCPSICSPLMRELARMVDKVEMEPGEDFQVLTVSFDPREHRPEKAKMVRNAERNLLGSIEREMPEGSWRVLTGTWENIAWLCETVGFHFYQNETGDFDHPAATIFISTDGKVTRYLHGVDLLAANVELALIDTMKGRERTTMRQIQQLCFSYDRESGNYVLQVNRIILAVSLVLVAVFVLFLLLLKRRGGRKTAPAGQEGGGR